MGGMGRLMIAAIGEILGTYFSLVAFAASMREGFLCVYVLHICNAGNADYPFFGSVRSVQRLTAVAEFCLIQLYATLAVKPSSPIFVEYRTDTVKSPFVATAFPCK